MTLETRHKTHQTQNLNIHIENSKLKRVDKQKLTGVFIDENLSWTTHIDYLCATISSKVSLLKQLSSYVPVEILYIPPLIDYGSNTWGTTSKHNIERLSKLQKRAARIILNVDYSTPSSEMFTELGLSTISDRHSYNKAVLTYKALNNLTKACIRNT